MPRAAAGLHLNLRLPVLWLLMYDVTCSSSPFILEVIVGPTQAPAALINTFPTLRHSNYLFWLKTVNP